MVRVRYTPNFTSFHEYYNNQALGRTPNTFSGPLVQRGHGLGGIFSSIFRTVAPIFRGVVAPLLKRGAKAVGKQAITAGAQIATDALAGKPIKQAFKARSQEAVDRLADKGSRQISKMLAEPKRAGRRPRKHIKGAQNRKLVKRDVFGHYR